MTNDELKRNAEKASADVQGRIEQGPVQEQISDHSEVFDDMPEYEAADQLIDDSRKAAKKRGWMWIAVAIAVLLGAAICVLMIPEITGTKTDNAATLAQATVSNAVDKTADAAASGVAVVEETVVDVQNDAAATLAGAADSVSTSASIPAATAESASDTNSGSDNVSSATIDDEARRVIHGDFGNGAQRKAALGSHYAAVQRRVNELMHA